jgi:acyl-CoA thioester hydrolase
MYTHEMQIRVRYGETDQMGYCYYGNYAEYFEVGRVETLRSLGLSYRSLEESGIMLPVLELHVKYIRPAYYDDLLTLRTSIAELPGARIRFTYELMNVQGQKINEAETTLVFINKNTNRPCPAPNALLDKLRPFFS